MKRHALISKRKKERDVSSTVAEGQRIQHRVLARGGYDTKNLEKPPPQEKYNDDAHARKRTILLQQQIPIDPHRRLAILPTILPQPARHFAHPLQAIAPVQQILDVLRHHLGHIPQLIVQLVEVLARARVLVRFLGALDEGVEFDEGVGPAAGGQVLLRGIGGGEFGGEVLEVGEGEFARVGAVADGEEDEGGGEEVARGEEGVFL